MLTLVTTLFIKSLTLISLLKFVLKFLNLKFVLFDQHLFSYSQPLEIVLSFASMSSAFLELTINISDFM